MGVLDILRINNPQLDSNSRSLPLFDNNKINSLSIALPTILHGFDDYFSSLGIDTAEFAAKALDMKFDEKFKIYYADFNCWQQIFGYNSKYDLIFDLATSMEKNNEGIFKYNNQTYIFWAWKGDYINLGVGAELGIYYGGPWKNFSHWKVDKSLAMPMTLNLKHKIYGNIVENWNNNGEDSWWITAFAPKYKKMKAQDLTVNFTVKFKNEGMFNAFDKIERKGWTFDKNKMIAYLNF